MRSAALPWAGVPEQPRPTALRLPGRTLDLRGATRVMGIVNVTGDSFYTPARTPEVAAAVRRGLELADRGAAIVDVGGMSAQPGDEIDAGEEAERVAAVISALRERSDVVVSVDTYRAPVADAALAAGAEIVNDHTGLSDPELAAVVARHGAALVVTHLGLAPKAAQTERYSISPDEIARTLLDRAATARAAGVAADAIMLDPGLGFGKTVETDLETLRRLPALLDLGHPLLLACSHKEVTAEPLGLPESALEGTAAVVAVASFLGVHVLRLHDLPFMAHVARMAGLLRPR
jgi:dihydropteroate synthase